MCPVYVGGAGSIRLTSVSSMRVEYAREMSLCQRKKECCRCVCPRSGRVRRLCVRTHSWCCRSRVEVECCP